MMTRPVFWQLYFIGLGCLCFGAALAGWWFFSPSGKPKTAAGSITITGGSPTDISKTWPSQALPIVPNNFIEIGPRIPTLEELKNAT